MKHCVLTQPNNPPEAEPMNSEAVKELLKQAIETINAQAKRIKDIEAMIDQLTDWQTDIQRELSRNKQGGEQ